LILQKNQSTKIKKEGMIQVKIKKIQINNFLGIEELDVTPNDKINMISGGNEKGKTSILESIEKVLFNNKRRSKLVRNEDEDSTLLIELDDGTEITRKLLKSGNESIKVNDGEKNVTKPETFLKDIAGIFSFNPVDFLDKKEKEQAEILLELIQHNLTREVLEEWFEKELLPKEINLEQHSVKVLEELAEKWFYDRRKEANTVVRETKIGIDELKEQLPDNYNSADWEDKNLTEIIGKVREANENNSNIQKCKEFVETKDSKMESIKNEFEVAKNGAIRLLDDEETNLKERIAELNRQLETVAERKQSKVAVIEKEEEMKVKELTEKIDKAQKYIDEHVIINTEEMQQEAEEIEKMKGFISLYKALEEKKEYLKQAKAKADKLDGYVDLARKKPAEIISELKMPITGLGINEEMQITIDELPIKNLSTSRQIKLAVEIARETSKELKLICIDRFESLDADIQKEFLNEINDDEFQYFITTVTSGPLKIN